MADSNPLQPSNRQWLWPALALLGLSLAGLAAFLCLRFASGFAFDPALLLAFRTPGDLATPIGPPWLLQSAIDISALGGYTVLWLAGAGTLIFLLAFGKRAEALLLGGSLIGASTINALLKLFLHRPRPDQEAHIRRQAAGDGGQGEQADPDQEDPAPPEPIARRPADQDQSAERQQIGVRHPLHRRRSGAEVFLDRRQGDAERRAVDEGQARPQHSGGEDPALVGFRQSLGHAEEARPVPRPRRPPS